MAESPRIPPSTQGRIDTAAHSDLAASLTGARPPMRVESATDQLDLPKQPPKDPVRVVSPTARILSEAVVPGAIATAGLSYAAFQLMDGGYVAAAVAALLGGGVAFAANRIAARNNSVPTQPSLESASPSDLIQSYKSLLDESSQFAVGDAQTFSGEIPRAKREEILARAAMTPSDAKMTAARRDLTSAAAIIVDQLKRASPEEKASILRGIANRMKSAKSGVCTTFAALGAHILSQTAQTHIPIEIIARSEKGGGAHATTHLFNVVGRNPDSDLSDPSTWGKDARVVDLWLGALGNANVYTPKEYAKWVEDAKVAQIYSNK